MENVHILQHDETFVMVQTQFPAIHCWPECPFEQVKFLQHPHRHIFYVRITVRVEHNDRDVEFLVLKRHLQDFIRANFYDKDLGRMSCEDIIDHIFGFLSLKVNIASIEVWEDKENGAKKTYSVVLPSGASGQTIYEGHGPSCS